MKLNNSNTKLRRPPKKKLNENTELTAKLTIDSELSEKFFIHKTTNLAGKSTKKSN